MQYNELIPLIRLRIYDERNPITVFRIRNKFEDSDDEYTAKVLVSDTEITGTVSTEEEGINENWSIPRDNKSNFEAMSQVIENTPGWSITGDAQNKFFLQENLMLLSGADAFNSFAELSIRYRFTDAELQREIDNVITEIDPSKTITELDLRFKMYVVNKVCCNVLTIRAVDTFGPSDIDVSSIAIPGVNVAFKTTNELWQGLAKVYCTLASEHGTMLVDGDISMPTINCNVITRYDNYYGVEGPYDGVSKPPSVIVTSKLRGSHPNYSVLLQWTRPDIMDFREYQVIKSENDIDIKTDGEMLKFESNDNEYQHTVHLIDENVEVGKTYNYRVMVVRNDRDNRKDVYSLSNVRKVEIPISVPPVASMVTITGTLSVGDVLTGNYNYSDVDGDLEQLYNVATPEITIEQCTQYSWYIAEAIADPNGEPGDTIPGVWTLISGAIEKLYTIQPSDTGKYLRFAVVPRTLIPNTTGLLVQSTEVKVI